MEYWEFLIQKEGDHTWLPLESPEVEILEGRYRVVARSARVNQSVEISITHETGEETGVKRRVQKRTRSTNPEGLIVILPFTRLKPGLWEMRCTGTDTTPEKITQQWQHSVKLEVLSVEAEAIPLLPHDSNESESSDIEIPETGPETTPSQTSATQTPETATPASQKVPVKQPLQLSLNRSTYRLQQGQPVVVSGQIDVSLLVLDVAAISAAEIQIQLRDPQNSQPIIDVRESLPEGMPPLSFACAVEIPRHCNSRLILGEISLYQGGGEPLDKQSFSITADVGDLLNILAEELSEQDLVDLSQDAYGKRLGEVLNQSFQNLKETIQNPQPVQFKPSSDPVLPPLLHKPASGTATPKPLDLPSFKSSNPQQQTPKQAPAKGSPQPPTPSPEAQPPEVAQQSEEATTTSEPALPELPTFELATPTVEVATPTPEPARSPVDEAFQALKLPDRFWSRLNSLATDEELPELLKEDLPPAPPPSDRGETEQIQSKNIPKTAKFWEEQEFVVEEEEVSARPKTQAKNIETVETEEAIAPLLLAADEPVPEPVLEVPKEALVAGRTVMVKVRLPDILPRIYVKVWLQDRQARVVLDGPYWVTEFYTNMWGDREGRVQLMIPYGSLDVLFEAIAMEMQTQRESYKVSIPGQVIPPAPPSLPLDNG